MSENSAKSKKGLLGKIAIGLFFVTVILWLSDPATQQQSGQSETTDKLKVTTIEVVPQKHQIDLSIVGTVQPRWPLTVVAAVSGRVSQFPEELTPGALIAKDALLLSINDAAYRSEVANVTARVKQAELEVARIKREQHIAENTAGRSKLTSYGRFEPHLNSAEAQLSAAQSNLEYAKQQLSETQISAPFDAIVLQKHVVPGQWINAGDQLFVLAASKSVDIQGEISSQQLSQLQGLSADTQVLIRTQSGSQHHAKLRFIDPNLSNTTRQLKVVFYVEQPDNSADRLKSNDMVTITIKGAEIEQVVTAPSSVLTPDGDVWLVESGKLKKHNIRVHQEFADKVYFTFSKAAVKPTELVRFPTSSMIDGQSVATERLTENPQETNMQFADSDGDVL